MLCKTKLIGLLVLRFQYSTVTVNDIKISQASPVNQTNTSTPVVLTFGGLATDYITNPTTPNTTFFVRISLYSDNAFTNEVDQGTVASSTATANKSYC